MCTLAGYVGQKQAAPILLEMSKRQEAVWSGFYTGLATVSDGRLYWDKVVGDTETLEKTTDVASFPGTVGLVHGRTPGGGNREWGHPLLDANETIACVEQGHFGRWKDHSARIELGNELLAGGYRFRSAVSGTSEVWPILSDGSYVHASELSPLGIGAEIDKGESIVDAIRTVVRRTPDEAIRLLIFSREPDHIYVANVNQRLLIGKDDSGTYMASSALAFPEGILWRAEVPANSIAVIGRESIEFQRLAPSDEMPVNETLPAGVDEAFMNFVRANPGKMLTNVVGGAIVPLLPEGQLNCEAPIGQRTLERMLAAGLIRVEVHKVVREDDKWKYLPAPQMMLFPAE